jgi:hypothetical protein
MKKTMSLIPVLGILAFLFSSCYSYRSIQCEEGTNKHSFDLQAGKSYKVKLADGQSFLVKSSAISSDTIYGKCFRAYKGWTITKDKGIAVERVEKIWLRKFSVGKTIPMIVIPLSILILPFVVEMAPGVTAKL